MDKNETAPRVETTHKLGNTTYVVNGIYASKGATATPKRSSVYLTEKRRSRRAKI